MPIDFAATVYAANYAVFARVVLITPLKSQPTAAPYGARGIYDTQPNDVLVEGGGVFSDQRTILDIIEKEFSILPIQGDQVYIPAQTGIPEAGTFEIIDADSNTFETTLTLRRIVVQKP